MHHGRLHLKEAAVFEKSPDDWDYLSSSFKRLSRLLWQQQIQMAISVKRKELYLYCDYRFHIFHFKKITFLKKQQSLTELRLFRPIDVFKISVFPFIIHLLTVMQVLKISKCQLPWKRNDFLLNVFLVVYDITKFHGDKWFNLHENTPFFHAWLIYLGSANRRPFNYIFERCNWSKRVTGSGNLKSF